MTDIGTRTARAAMRRFGQDATYTPTDGDPVTVRIILDRDVQPTQGGQQSTTVERRTELTGYHDELGDARRSELVVIGDDTWRLDRLDRDDGYLVTWFVVHIAT